MNSSWYQQADDYLYGRMTREERTAFESALTEDKMQSVEFEIYRSIEATMQNHGGEGDDENTLRFSLAGLNKIYFSSADEGRRRTISPKIFRWTVAAVIILTVAGLYLLTISRTSEPHRLAENYIQSRLSILGVTMSGSGGFLREGIVAYNNKDFKKSLGLFDSAARFNPGNSDAKKYAGLALLQMRSYDSAIARFDELTAQKDLYGNPGLFLKAITLLHRNGKDDIMHARQLLEQVVTQKTEGADEAAKWLKRF
jgi:tetratricopeptide (TPR) repeat protein